MKSEHLKLTECDFDLIGVLVIADVEDNVDTFESPTPLPPTSPPPTSAVVFLLYVRGPFLFGVLGFCTDLTGGGGELSRDFEDCCFALFKKHLVGLGLEAEAAVLGISKLK